MKHATFACFAVLVAGVASQPWGSQPFLSSGLFKLGSSDLVSKSQDFLKYGATAGQSSTWAGQNFVKNNAQQNNANQLQEKAQASNQNFGLAGSSSSNAAKLISDEARRNQQVASADAAYKSVDNKAATGSSAADAKSASFNNGAVLNDRIDYAYGKKYDKVSAENGGSQTEDARSASRSDVIKEKEKDYTLQRDQAATSRAQDSQQQAAKEWENKSSAAQKQAQDAKYGNADRSLSQADQNSDGRLIDYGRKDSRDVDQEAGRQEASRLAKDISEHAAGYQNEAAASVDASKNAADKKYYGGAGAGQYGGAGSGGAGWAGSNGYYPVEAVGGSVGSGFNENSAQKQKASQAGSDKTLSAAESRDDYNLNKDKTSYSQIEGLKDYKEGAFKQGINDNSAQGFAGKNAEAARASHDLDRDQAAASSSASLSAADKKEKEALKDRVYEREVKKDENEKVTHKQAFYNNNNEAGNTDEFLKYDRQKNENQFGNAEQARASKEDEYNIVQEDGKAGAQSKKYEDFADSRASAEKESAAKDIFSKGFEQQSAQDAARAQAGSSGFDKAAFQASKDDSQSGAYNQYQNLNDKSGANHLSQQVKAAEVSYPQTSNYNNDDLWRAANTYKPQVIPSYSAPVKPLTYSSPVQPSYGKVGSGYPGTGYPGTGYPGTGYPGTGYPGVGYPGTGYPGTGYPGTGYPGTGYPGTGYPGTGYPGTGYPGTGYPGTGYTGTNVLPQRPPQTGYSLYPQASSIPSSKNFVPPYGTNSFGSKGYY